MTVQVRAQFPFVGIDGTAMREELRREIVEVWVDDHLVLPDSVFVRLRFDDPELWNRLGISIGQTIDIRAGQLGEAAESALIKAEITSIEAVYEYGNRFLVIRGYDPSHRLQIGRKTRSFNNVTDSDLARRIADDAGLSVGTIDSTTTVHDHVSQINTTDWEFLRWRAQEIGFKVAVRDGQFSFTAADGDGGGGGGLGGAVGGLAGGGASELAVGRGLLCFRPRVTGAQQVSRVEARGWDMARKQAVTHEADAATTSVTLEESRWTPADLADVFGGQPYLTCERPIATADEAQALAESTAALIASSFAEAEGTAEGNPAVVTGGQLTITGAGPFDGEYFVSHARHRFDESGYHTDFEVAGHQERSLLGLSSLGATAGGAPPIYGAVVALVTNAQDPEQLGRVKVQFPWLSDDYESDWARVASPGAGASRGFFNTPEVDDEVLVVFERGDMRRPYVLGGLYNGVDAPPADGYVDDSDGGIKARRWTSAKGHEIAINEQSNDDSIVLTTSGGGFRITISESGELIEIKSDAKVLVDAAREIELKGGDVTISGTSVTIEADGNLAMSGGNATLESSGQTEVKGGIVKLN